MANANYLVRYSDQSQIQDFTGRQIERAPDWTANFGVDYTAHFGGGALVLSSNVAYNSSYYPRNAGYDPATHKNLYRQKGYAIVNSQATYNFAGDNFSLGVWASRTSPTCGTRPPSPPAPTASTACSTGRGPSASPPDISSRFGRAFPDLASL